MTDTRYPAGPRRGAVAVIVRDDRFLVIKRSQFVSAPGKYCFPGGEIEPGESEVDALCRELHEELKLDVQPIRRLWSSETAWGVQLYWWLADVLPDDVPRPNPQEVESADWLTRDEILALDELLASNRQFFAALAGGEFELPPVDSDSGGKST